MYVYIYIYIHKPYPRKYIERELRRKRSEQSDGADERKKLNRVAPLPQGHRLPCRSR